MKKGATGPPRKNNTHFSTFRIPGSAANLTNHAFPHPRAREATHLTEVNKKRAGGPIHSIICVAGIRAPHIFHPLKRQEPGKDNHEPPVTDGPTHPRTEKARL